MIIKDLLWATALLVVGLFLVLKSGKPKAKSPAKRKRPEERLTYDEAAEMLHVSKRDLVRLVQAGHVKTTALLPFQKKHGNRCIIKSSVEKLARKGK